MICKVRLYITLKHMATCWQYLVVQHEYIKIYSRMQWLYIDIIMHNKYIDKSTISVFSQKANNIIIILDVLYSQRLSFSVIIGTELIMLMYICYFFWHKLATEIHMNIYRQFMHFRLITEEELIHLKIYLSDTDSDKTALYDIDVDIDNGAADTSVKANEAGSGDTAAY